MRKELPESYHHAVDNRKEQVDGDTSDQGPGGGRLVENQGWRLGGLVGRCGDVVAGRVLLAVGVYRDARLGERVVFFGGHGVGRMAESGAGG